MAWAGALGAASVGAWAGAVSAAAVRTLDQEIVREKYHLLTHPTYREEIDYIIKPVSRVKEQLAFDTFEHMVAAKILQEGLYLLGSREVFKELKGMIREAGVPSKLARLERKARAYRLQGEVRLKGWVEEPSPEILERYFYTREEDPEIY